MRLRGIVAVLALATAGAPVAQAVPPSSHTQVVCSAPAKKGQMRCLSLLRTGIASPRTAQDTPAGYGPSDIQDAYNLPAGGGAGMTVAIVDAFDDPSAEADLAAWRTQYGLPPCTTANGCFRKIDQRGGTDYPAPNGDWAVEISLDLDAVSAACPACHLLLVESDDNLLDNLGAAVNQAVAQGAPIVSNSYGGDEDPAQTDFDSQFFDHPGTAIVASSGDFGYGVEYPAASQFVTSVGGTSLVRDSNSSRGWAETVWDSNGQGPGSGCSQFDAKPSWQGDSGCDMRAVADVSAVADPNTGLAVYDTFQQSGWLVAGGTSLAAPLIAGVYALGGKPGSGEYPASYAYAQPPALNDVTSGKNGSCDPAYLCTAGPGYDGPTGLGSPNGTAAFKALGPHGDVAGTVTDASSGAPIAKATVSAGAARDTTDVQGHYDLTLPVGTHDVTATMFGYDASQASVTIAEGATATHDFALAAQPRVTLRGTVSEGSGHGWPLAATLTVAGMPGGTFRTDPATGRYSVSLPADATYQVSVAGGYPGLTPQAAAVALGGTDVVHDFRLPADPYTCTAPGYQAGDNRTVYQQTFDDPTTPAGWTVADNAGNDDVWRFDDDRGFGNRTGGDGLYAWVFSAGYGPDEHQDTSLVSPVFDLSSVDTPAVWFDTDYSADAHSTADVDVSVDGGTTWTNAWRQTTGSVFSSRVMAPIPQAAGQSQVRFRFHYMAAFDGWWMVDDAAIGDRVCTPQDGGLLLGRVSDRNTGSALAGATVAGTTSDSAGSYWTFSPGGARPFTASMTRYQALTQTVDVAANATTVADFALAAGNLSIAQDSVDATMPLGGTATRTVTIRNDGTAPATLDLSETPDGSTPLASHRGAPVQTIRGHFSPHIPRRMAAPGTANYGVVAAGAGPWTSAADYTSALAYNVAGYNAGTVYVVGGESAAGVLRSGHAYDAASGAWRPIADMPQARAAPVAGFLGGKLYIAGGWAETSQVRADLDVYDPHTDRWSAGPAMPNAVAAAGTAVLGGKLYAVGGCQSSCGKRFAYRYDSPSRQWSKLADYPVNAAWLSCGGIGAKLYCAGGVSDNGGSPGTRTYAYDPATNTWTRLADLPIDLWGAGSTVADGTLMMSGGVTDDSTAVTNQGFAYHPATNTWTALPNSNHAVYAGASACGFYKIGGMTLNGPPTRFTEVLPGYAACDTADPVPWLTGTPATATLPAGGSTQVTITLDARTVSQPGTYTAVLNVRNDTPYETGSVRATITVTPPLSWGKITGTVTGVTCSGSSAAVPGATVAIDGKVSDYTLRTDARGQYAQWLDQANGTLSITVAATDWFPKTITARVRAGQTIVQNVTLNQTGCSS